MPYPTDALKQMKSLLNQNGIVIVVHLKGQPFCFQPTTQFWIAGHTFAEALPSEATTVCLTSLYCLPQSRPEQPGFKFNI